MNKAMLNNKMLSKKQHVISDSNVHLLPHFQKGLTLIELMVAMVIGLFLLLGISSVYLSNLKSDKARSQYSLLEDNARLALDSMSRIIEHAGYQGTARTNADKFISTAVTSNACVVNNNALYSAFDKTKDDDSGDQFTGDRVGVVYLGSTSFNTDCAGNAIPVKCQIGNPAKTFATDLSRIYNAFYIDKVGNDGKLKCIGSRTVGAQLIADNIENMQITYGIDSDNDPNKDIDQYVDAKDINAGDWGQVKSVQIAVLVKSDKEIKNIAEQKTYSLLGKQITAPKGANKKDKYQRAVFSTTILLGNY